MFWVVAGAIGLVVFVMSRPQGEKQRGQSVPENAQIPSTGSDAVQSPATTGAAVLSTSRGKLVLGTNTGLPASSRGHANRIFVPPPVDENDIDLQKALDTQEGIPVPFNSQLKLGPKL